MAQIESTDEDKHECTCEEYECSCTDVLGFVGENLGKAKKYSYNSIKYLEVLVATTCAGCLDKVGKHTPRKGRNLQEVSKVKARKGRKGKKKKRSFR